ncbi:Transcriptional regulator SlyA [Sporomusa carbonis]|uniref:MarR family winged helix-turn-helix transcriptional regulator n=1 Tax=Sporomusa carbonis TaxID=3076075 RepID=UPI003A6C1B19
MKLRHQNSIGFIIHHTDLKVSHLLSARFRAYDITPEQWFLLNRLAEQDGINQKELSERAGKNQTIITRMIDILERKGFITKQTDSQDRRAFLIYLTDKGRSIQDELAVLEEEAIENALQGIPAEDVAKFRETLLQIYENITAIIRETKS